ncbi:MAG TPA: hypothetical protein VIT67_17380, partial [Povalibacter sp.]
DRAAVHQQLYRSSVLEKRMRYRRPSLLDTLLSRLTRRKSSKPAPAPVSRFQAIAIYRGIKACEMAKRFSDHRFLQRDAPALPLPQCSMPHQCECRYLKFKDRRGAPRRVVDFGSSTSMKQQAEKRNFRGRRKAD